MTLDHASSARIPARGLAALAGLRRLEGLWVVPDGEHVWVSWEPGDERALRAILPVEGIELYERKGKSWHRVGQRLPSSEVPPAVEPIPLARAVTPVPCSAEPPSNEPRHRLPLRLVRDARPRPTSAMLCPLDGLGRWVESAPSSEIGAIRGALQGALALLLGSALPALPGSTRFWGNQLLVPIGFEVRPTLPEATLLEALGDPGLEILRVVPDGQDGESPAFAVEAIPIDAFRPLTRAGVRLALVGAPPS